jgi:hypothetical protein
MSVQRGLDLVDGVWPDGRSIVGDGRDDRGQAVVGWHLTPLTRPGSRGVVATRMLAHALSL